MPTVRERNKRVIDSLTVRMDLTADAKARMAAIHKAAVVFAKVVNKNTESGPESTLAQRNIEDACMRGVRSVIFELPVADDGGAEPVVKVARKTVAKKTAAPAKKTVKRKSV